MARRRVWPSGKILFHFLVIHVVAAFRFVLGALRLVGRHKVNVYHALGAARRLWLGRLLLPALLLLHHAHPVGAEQRAEQEADNPRQHEQYQQGNQNELKQGGKEFKLAVFL